MQAEDDPIAPVQAIPFKSLEANSNCVLVVTPTGGHLGWTSGPGGVRAAPWSDRGVVEYFSAVQQLLSQEGTRGEFAAAGSKPRAGAPAGVWTVDSSGRHQAP